jgi:hypothetical protein
MNKTQTESKADAPAAEARNQAKYETLIAYCDSDGEYDYSRDRSKTGQQRNLNFRSSVTVSPHEAATIMEKALAPGGGYNDFTPQLLRLLPPQARVRLARESSVCVYVESKSNGVAELHRKMKADEFDLWESHNGTYVYRIWWD